MVNELSIQINSSNKHRRKMVAVEVLVKKDVLKKLERRLENAVGMFYLALQSYLVARTRVHPDIIIKGLQLSRSNPTPTMVHLTKTPMIEDLNLEAEAKGQAGPSSSKTHSTTTAYQVTHLNSRPPCCRASTNPSIFGKLLVSSYASNFRVLFQAPVWPSRRS
ncbi:hypothetical protein GGR53DRAFT_13400 [Hypoxylon sp. FL1150]|nr:hypothetical protein GGR53DRAFT_13400 [Hypoxylon sp. FL1150]